MSQRTKGKLSAILVFVVWPLAYLAVTTDLIFKF